MIAVTLGEMFAAFQLVFGYILLDMGVGMDRLLTSELWSMFIGGYFG